MNLKKTFNFISLLPTWLFCFISNLVPKNKKIWVFIGWHKNTEREIFADNSKYLFLHCLENRKNIQSVWLGQDQKISEILKKQGLTSYSINSWRGKYYALRAQYTFIDAFLNIKHWPYCGGSRIIQLWHGKGLKKTGFNSPYSLPRYSKLLNPNLFKKCHKAIASSEYTAHLMASTFRMPEEDVLITGLPRNDVLFKNIAKAEIDVNVKLSKKILETSEYKILYAPTFRPNGSSPLEQFDWKELNALLYKKKSTLFIQLHPKFSQTKLETKNFSNIFFVEPGYDIYPLLKNFQALITDYSSIFIDYLLLNRPIIFYIYDLETYQIEMGLQEDFEILTPGVKAKNFSELLAALNNLNSADFEKQRTNIQKNLFAFNDGNSSARILEKLGI